jgi:MFS family permease
MNDKNSIFALNGAVFLLMFGVGMIVARLPDKILQLSGSVTQVGALAATFAISYILFQIPVGRLADRFGCKWFLAGGYFICAIAGLLFYSADTSVALLIGRMIQGIGEAPVWALAPALLSILYPRNKARVMGWYNASLHIGLMGGSLTGVLLSHIWHDTEAFLLFSALSALGGLWIGAAVCPQNVPRQKTLPAAGKMRDMHALLGNRSILIVFWGIFLYGIGYGLFLTIIPAFLIQAKQATADNVGYFFALFYTAISFAQIVIGPMADRIGRKIPMIAGMLVAALGMFTFPSLSLPLTLAVLALSGGGLGVFLVASLAFLNDQVSAAYKATISGAFYLFWGLGFFLGPILMGMAGDAGWYAGGFAVMGALYLLLAFLLLPLTDSEQAGH